MSLLKRSQRFLIGLPNSSDQGLLPEEILEFLMLIELLKKEKHEIQQNT